MLSLPLNLQPSRSATGRQCWPRTLGLLVFTTEKQGLRKRPLCTGASDPQPPEVEKFQRGKHWEELGGYFRYQHRLPLQRTPGVPHMPDTNVNLWHLNIIQGLARGGVF